MATFEDASAVAVVITPFYTSDIFVLSSVYSDLIISIYYWSKLVSPVLLRYNSVNYCDNAVESIPYLFINVFNVFSNTTRSDI